MITAAVGGLVLPEDDWEVGGYADGNIRVCGTYHHTCCFCCMKPGISKESRLTSNVAQNLQIATVVVPRRYFYHLLLLLHRAGHCHGMGKEDDGCGLR